MIVGFFFFFFKGNFVNILELEIGGWPPRGGEELFSLGQMTATPNLKGLKCSLA